MKKLQAAMKDVSAKRWRENKVHYQVGSYFKGCRNCGETEWVELPSGKEVERWLTGHKVYRAYDPQWTGYTWYCYECSAKDLKCWDEDANGTVSAQLGKPPIMGTAEAKKAAKYRLLHGAVKVNPLAKAPKISDRDREIAELERQIEELVAKMKGGKQ